MTERGSFKKYPEAVSRIPFFKKAVHNKKLPLTYSEFTVHMQNQLKVGSLIFAGTKAGVSYYVQFFSYARVME